MIQSNLKAFVAELAQIAIKAADPFLVVEKALIETPLELGPQGACKIIAVGKAASAMMQAVLAKMPPGQAYEAIIVTNYENASALNVLDIPNLEIMAAGHPVPDANGLKAAQRVEALLQSAGENDQIISLISGGGSALLPAPAGHLTLEEKADISQLMLSAGLDITEMNSVRQHLSRLKGGGMLQVAAPAPVISFILSDVIGDDLRVIASGPTVSPIATRSSVVDMLKQKGLFEQFPDSAKQILQDADTSVPNIRVLNTLVGSNRLSLDAMLQAVPDHDIQLVSDSLVGDVSDACEQIISVMRSADLASPTIFLWGGETTVNLKGAGLGGRNQELALRVALAAESLSLDGAGFDFVFGSVGTDGRDGPTDAAGGIVDNFTTRKIRALGIDPNVILAQNDSYNGLKLAGDLFITGATGTNVADIQILVCQPRQNLSH